MKRTLKIASFALLLSIFIFGHAFAQPNGFDIEKLRSEKIAFFTNALELSPAEAEKFWPTYNEYEKKKWELIGKRRESEHQLNNGLQNKSEKECAELSRKIASILLDEGKLAVEYNEKFLKVLSAKKVVLIFNTEKQFMERLLRSYKGPR